MLGHPIAGDCPGRIVNIFDKPELQVNRGVILWPQGLLANGYKTGSTKDDSMQPLADELEKHARNLPLAVPGIKALIIDDSIFDRRRIRKLSSAARLDITLDEIASIESLDDVLDRDRFDVILIDYNLPTGDGIDALARIRRHTVNGNCPTIMVTGDDNSQVAVRSLKMGCSDYIAKDRLTADSLRRCIIGAVQLARRRSASPESEAEMVAAAVMSRCTNALQPRLAGVIREMRALRHGLRDGDAGLSGDLERIERQCIKLWAALLDPKLPANDSGTTRH